MIRFALQVLLCLGLCPLLAAQQQSQPASTPPDAVLTAAAPHPASEAQPLDAASERILVLRNARTLSIDSKTVFLTTSTLERALMKNKDWEKLDLNIVSTPSGADLQIDVDRLPFTHIHTYTLTDRKTGIVLTSGRIRAFDGVVASGPMADKIVSVIFAARFPALPAKQ
jgi:hypothetical protein